jgi:hypothetical protein
MEDKWEYESTAVAVSDSNNLTIGKSYQIKGRGNLQYNSDPNVGGKTGYGFCLEEELNNFKDYKLSHKDRVKWHYFTISEMNELFITYHEHYKSIERDQKINTIIKKNI